MQLLRVQDVYIHEESEYIVQYSLRFKIKVTFGEIFLKLYHMNWNVARNKVNVVKMNYQVK